MKKKIYVTQPSLPPLEKLVDYLKEIWDNKILTNNGPFHHKLERELSEFLGVKYISLFSNGTLALVTALQALKIVGEVITTPYSFVATTHAIWWNNLKPVFVDIDVNTLNIDTKKIESAITPKTTAILPVHVYGIPCNIEEIERIAKIHGLKVIYDAAHAFGVNYKGNSILNYGDLSILSFHATKVFNTIEGGAIISHKKEDKDRIDFLKNFGFASETEVVAQGINAKMNEIQSAYGLLQIEMHNENIKRRREIAERYEKKLEVIEGVDLITMSEEFSRNYSYFPIFINATKYGISRDELYFKLKSKNIFARRYFYPLISNMPTYSGLPSAAKTNLHIANKVSEQVICLPIYPNLTNNDVDVVVEIIRESKK